MIIEANEFILKDAAGRVQARLTATDNGPVFLLYDQNDQTRVLINVGQHASSISLNNETGRPQLTLHSMKGRASISLNAESSPRASLHVDGTLAGLSIGGESARPLLFLSLDRGNQGLVLCDEDGKPRALLELTKDGPRLRFFGEDGSAIFSEP